jgi:hypothetical protein
VIAFMSDEFSKKPVYRYHFDALDAVLVYAMGRVVRHRLNSGLGFTAANQVHVPSLELSLAVQCRTTQCSKLGLIAKCVAEGRQVPGVWVITDRGFAALRGEPVQDFVDVKDGEIDNRSLGRVTISEAFLIHREAVEAAAARNRKVKGDYRAFAASYKPEEWYEVVQGRTIPIAASQPNLI